MSIKNRLNTYAAGFAMFAMFFGAGSVTFPLEVGRISQENVFAAILGLILTAVGIPFLGVIVTALNDGCYQTFFKRFAGNYSVLISGSLILLIGPLGGIPRCIALSYSNLSLYFSLPGLLWFSLCYALCIAFLCIKKDKIISIVGYVLTPLLLLAILIIFLNGSRGETYNEATAKLI